MPVVSHLWPINRFLSPQFTTLGTLFVILFNPQVALPSSLRGEFLLSSKFLFAVIVFWLTSPATQRKGCRQFIFRLPGQTMMRIRKNVVQWKSIWPLGESHSALFIHLSLPNTLPCHYVTTTINVNRAQFLRTNRSQV